MSVYSIALCIGMLARAAQRQGRHGRRQWRGRSGAGCCFGAMCEAAPADAPAQSEAVVVDASASGPAGASAHGVAVPKDALASDAAALAASKRIDAEAARIKRPAAHIGFFELAAWCALRGRDLTLVWGSNEISMAQYYPQLRAHLGQDNRGQARAAIAGCVWNETLDDWAALHDPVRDTLRHFVGAVRLDGTLPPDPARADRHEKLAFQLQAMGYVMIPTDQNGDCGIDALTFWDLGGVQGTPHHWRATRQELYDFMKRHRADPQWHDLFKACQEGDRNFTEVDPAAPSSLCEFEVERTTDGEDPASNAATDSECESDVDADALWDDLVGDMGCERRALEKALGTPVLASGLVAKEVGPTADNRGASAPGPTLVDASASHASSAGAGLVAGGPSDPSPASGDMKARPESASPAEAKQSARHLTFQQYVQQLSECKIQAALQSAAAWRDLESNWEKTLPRKTKTAYTAGSKGYYSCKTLQEKISEGRLYQAWLSTEEGKAAVVGKRQARAFLARGTALLLKEVSKKACMRLKRAYDLVLDIDAEMNGTWTPKKKRKLVDGKVVEVEQRPLSINPPDRRPFTKCGADRCVANANRRRRAGAQGLQKTKAWELREALYDWFVDIRFGVKSRITSGRLLKQGETICARMLRRCHAQGQYPRIPRLTPDWVRRWRRHYGVSLVKPTARYKVSRVRLLARLRVMWLGVLRVRLLALATLKRDLKAWGIDQKPLHMNEAGSKQLKGLALAGETLDLKENVAATRERVSLMTLVTSDEAEATWQTVPVELLFKGKKDGILRGCRALKTGLRITFQHAPKGSYRLEHVLRFLEQHLPEFTEERKSANDYRLLFLDAYAAHLDEQIWDLAWSRGFVTMIHGAGTTGIAQVNDTHLHSALETKYCEVELETMELRQTRRPGDIGRDREEVALDLAITWRSLDHRSVARGHVHNGLTNALDSTQDRDLADNIKALWVELGIYELREESRKEIFAKVEAGELGWNAESIKSIMPSWGSHGHGAYAREGRELEAVAKDDEIHWLTTAADEEEGVCTREEEETERALENADREESRRRRLEESAGPHHEIEGTLVPALPDDTEAAKAEAAKFVEKQRMLEQVIALAADRGMQPIRAFAQRKLAQHLKYAVGGSPAEGGSSAERTLINRVLAAQRAQEQEATEKMRKRNHRIRVRDAKAQLARKKITNKLCKMRLKKREEKAAAAAKTAAEAKAKAATAQDFNPPELGQGRNNGGGKKEKARRTEFLDRMRHLHPLPPEVEKYWPQFRVWWPTWIGITKGKTTGSWIVQEMKAFEKTDGKTDPFAAWVKKQWRNNLASAWKPPQTRKAATAT